MKRKRIWVLVVWSPMLVIVDHLHIQYNGFLFGILLISPSCLEEGRDLTGGLVFAMLCFKHLFAVVAPIYFVYLLRHYCWKGLVRDFWRLLVLGAVVVAVFALAYGYFVYHGQGTLPCLLGGHQIFWCSILDKVLAFVLGRLDSTFRHQQRHSLVD